VAGSHFIRLGSADVVYGPTADFFTVDETFKNCFPLKRDSDA
jgi:hypothetical protein